MCPEVQNWTADHAGQPEKGRGQGQGRWCLERWVGAVACSLVAQEPHQPLGLAAKLTPVSEARRWREAYQDRGPQLLPVAKGRELVWWPQAWAEA